MRFKLLAASITFIIAQHSFAATLDMPTSCPAASAIQSKGVTTAYDQGDGFWLAIEWKNTYGTDREWTFVTGEFTANSASDAIAQGNAATRGMVFTQGPNIVFSDQKDLWVCLYKNNSDINGAAFTPAMTPVDQIVKLLRRK